MEEVSIAKQEFKKSMLFPWSKTTLEITNRRFKGEKRNTLLGIPAGKQEITYPLKNIASVSTSSRFHLGRFLFGLLFIFLGLTPATEGFATSFVVSIFGLNLLLNCYTTKLKITNSAGESPVIEFAISEIGNVQRFTNSVNDTIAKETA